MKNLNFLKTNKEEVIQKTIELLQEATIGNGGMFIPSLAFFITEDGEVDYFPYTGNIVSESVFYTLPSHEISDIDIESIDNIHFHEYINQSIDNYIEYYDINC